MPEIRPFRWTILWRIACSLLCAVLASGLGLAQPFIWFWIWSALLPGLFGAEYQMLLPAIIATVGAVGGGAIGLIAGGVAPGRVGFGASLLGLGATRIATGLYFLTAPGDTVFAAAAILVPAMLMEFAMALALLVLWPTLRRNATQPNRPNDAPRHVGTL